MIPSNIRVPLVACAAATLAAVAILSGAQIGSTHDQSLNGDCDSLDVMLTSYDRNATALVIADGLTLHEGTFGGRLVQSWPITGNVEHTYSVVVKSNDGARYNVDWSKTTEGCYVPPVIPEYPGDILTTVNGDSVLDCEAKTSSYVEVAFKAVGTWNPETEEYVYGEPVETGRRTVTRDATVADCPPVIPPVEPPICADGEELVDGKCALIPVPPIDPTCEQGEEVSNGICVPADEPNPDPSFQPQPRTLATTGVDLTGVYIGGGLLAAGIAFLLFRRRLRPVDEPIDDHSDLYTNGL